MGGLGQGSEYRVAGQASPVSEAGGPIGRRELFGTMGAAYQGHAFIPGHPSLTLFRVPGPVIRSVRYGGAGCWKGAAVGHLVKELEVMALDRLRLTTQPGGVQGGF
jgi:hypothetical protein